MLFRTDFGFVRVQAVTCGTRSIADDSRAGRGSMNILVTGGFVPTRIACQSWQTDCSRTVCPELRCFLRLLSYWDFGRSWRRLAGFKERIAPVCPTSLTWSCKVGFCYFSGWKPLQPAVSPNHSLILQAEPFEGNTGCCQSYAGQASFASAGGCLRAFSYDDC